MTIGQRWARIVTTVVVRVPFAWKLFRGNVTRTFDKLAPSWDTRMDDERLRPMRSAFAALPQAPARILDLGTGSGRVARVAKAQWPDADVVGADVSPGMIEEARQRSTGERYDVADSAALPYDDGAFDLVTLNNMIPFFDEVGRVTGSGGHVVVAYTMGDKTPIYVPLDRVRAELERRGFAHVADFPAGPGVALLARKA
jgi:ubiquinone/menaquinone biosynthesis C-methylase UbiE